MTESDPKKPRGLQLKVQYRIGPDGELKELGAGRFWFFNQMVAADWMWFVLWLLTEITALAAPELEEEANRQGKSINHLAFNDIGSILLKSVPFMNEHFQSRDHGLAPMIGYQKPLEFVPRDTEITKAASASLDEVS